MKNSTINYYDLNAQKYAESTVNVEVSEQIKNFCSQLSPNSKILDIGCGSGRDSLYFINNGFKVCPIDASNELAKIASELIQQEVTVCKIEEFKKENEFDAIWAMASLLHLKKIDLPIALNNCVQSFKKDQQGLLFASFKVGNGESYDENGRFFSYYQPEELKSILESTEYFDKIEYQINKDKMGRGNDWISFCATKKMNLYLTNPSKKSPKI